jgi:hypothetical protein
MSFFEWLGRVIMLVLAGMITLSIISALAAISSQTSVPRQLGFERAQAPVAPEPEPIPPPSQGAARPTTPEANMTDDSARSVPIAPAVHEPVDPARWLEAITYALLALAGLAVLGCLLLWRLLHQQRRIADALSAAPPPSFGPPTSASPGG